MFNDKKFLDDLKGVRDVMVFTSNSNAYLHISKRELLKEAQTLKIHYYLTDKIFVVKRMVMVVV